MTQADHLLLGAPSLEEGTAFVRALLGVEAAPGGGHPGVGTHNALLSLGKRTYLEIIAPDPNQDVPRSAWPYGLGRLTQPRLFNWAVRPGDWEVYVKNLAVLGVQTRTRDGSRQRPDGQLLKWKSLQLPIPTQVRGVDLTGLIPFPIDWLDSPLPAADAPAGPSLESLEVRHPDAAAVKEAVEVLHLPCKASGSGHPGLEARIRLQSGDTVALT